ncbi:MAG: iron-sulfur cluster repair di-iron protein [Calditrichaeota bacterium]|nr:iron-sulfur cluster repair di-iron protein [Calditrichota bacterium]
MSIPYQNRTVGQLVAERPARARVFERFGIDYCCGGRVSLAEAASSLGLDPAVIERALSECDAGPENKGERDWLAASPIELIDDILARHHTYLKVELPRLDYLVHKVASVHSANHPYLKELAQVFVSLRSNMLTHLAAEEETIFPAIRKVNGNPEARRELTAHIALSTSEHDLVGAMLHRINQLTGNYSLPPDGCETFRALLHGLSVLEGDTHIHVHKENNILFPKVLAA